MRLYAARYRYPHERVTDQSAQVGAILAAVNGAKNATFDDYKIQYYRPAEATAESVTSVVEFKPRGKRKRSTL